MLGRVVIRRRGAALEAAILEAARAELELGWARFSVERVAERAGTGKAALYRRWPNREALARAAVVHEAATTLEALRPTGRLREDLLRFARIVAQAYDGPLGQAVRGIVAATHRGDGGVPVEPAWPAAQIVTEILGAAGRRPVGDPKRLPLVLDVGVSLISHHALVTGSAPDPQALALIVDEVWLPALLRITTD